MAGCSQNRRVGIDGGELDGASPDAQRCADCDVLIAILVSKTGLLAGTGDGIVRGAQLACDEVNAAGGALGKKLGLRVEDDGTARNSAAAAFSRALADSSVVAVLGPTSSSAAFPLREEAERHNITMVLLAPTGDWSVPGDEDCRSCFRLAPEEIYLSAPHNSPLVATVVSLVSRGLAEPRARLVALRNEDGQGFRSALRTLEMASSLKVPEDPVYYDETAGVASEQDPLATQAAMVVEARPDVVYLGSFVADGVRLTRALKKHIGASYRPVLMGSWPLMFNAFVAAADPAVVEGLVGTAPRPPARHPQYAKFAAAYRAAYASAPPLFAEGAYDATYLIAYALERAGRVERGMIADGLRALSGPPGERLGVGHWREGLAALRGQGDFDYEGAAGSIDWDWRGNPLVQDARDAYVIYRIAQGRTEILSDEGSP